MLTPSPLPLPKKILCVFSIIIGVITLYFATNNYLYWSHFEHVATKTTGTIVRFAQSTSSDSSGSYQVYTPIFSFTDQFSKKHEVKAKASERNPSDRLGDLVPVIYEPSKPEEAKMYRFTELYLWASLLGAFALIMLFLGIFPLLKHNYQNKKIQWLIDNGEKVEANVNKVKLINIRQSAFVVAKLYTIEAEWKDPSSGQTYSFSSKKYGARIFSDPSPQLAKTVTVLIDRNNPSKNYVMDLSFLK